MRAILLFFLLTGILLHSYAQEQPEHAKTTYIDSTGKFYINKALPVYLRLSTSPEDDAPSHLLKSKQSAAYTNPMYLDTEGYNTIRSPSAVNPETKEVVKPRQDIVFTVYADGIAPEVKADFQNAEYYQDKWGEFYGKGLRIIIKGRDAVSGIKTIFYSLNGQPYKSFKDSLDFSGREDGEYTLRYYAVDNVGNASEVDSVTFNYDTTPPKGRIVLYGVQEGENLLSKESQLLLRSRDNLSGERAIYYSMNDASFIKYTGPLNVGELPEGKHNIKYYVVDNVGNVSKTKDGSMKHVEFNFVMDKTPPEVDIMPVGGFYKGKRLYVSENTDIKVKVTDAKGRVEWTRYNINRKDTLKPYNGSFKLEGDEGWYKVYVRAKDFMDNQTQLVSKSFYKDTKAPVTGIDYVNNHFFARDTLFINKNTRIKLFAKDEHAGIKQIYYALNGSDFKKYSEPFAISESGAHNIAFYSEDRVNHKEQEKRSDLFVDNQPPVIHAHFSVQPFGKQSREGKNLKVYPTNTRIYLGATDRSCGTKQITYSINGSAFQDHASGSSLSTEKTFREPGFYKLEIKATDILDNQSAKTVRFFIKER